MNDPVKVKPLEWRDDEPFFQGEPDSVFRSEANGAGYGYVAEVVVGTPGELDREKAKSETIYTARILAALDLTGVEAMQAEIKRLREAIAEATHPDFIFGALDNVNDMDVSLTDFAEAVSRAIRAALGDTPDGQ